jgi:hypothetical protein
MLAIRPQPLVKRPSPRRVQVRPRADLNETLYFAGKFIGSFVLFTSSMNWWYYRQSRKDRDPKN